MRSAGGSRPRCKVVSVSKWGKCDECGGEVWFDAHVTADGVVVNTFETAFCPRCGEDGDGEIKHGYTIIEGSPPCR